LPWFAFPSMRTTLMALEAVAGMLPGLAPGGEAVASGWSFPGSPATGRAGGGCTSPASCEAIVVAAELTAVAVVPGEAASELVGVAVGVAIVAAVGAAAVFGVSVGKADATADAVGVAASATLGPGPGGTAADGLASVGRGDPAMLPSAFAIAAVVAGGAESWLPAFGATGRAMGDSKRTPASWPASFAAAVAASSSETGSPDGSVFAAAFAFAPAVGCADGAPWPPSIADCKAWPNGRAAAPSPAGVAVALPDAERAALGTLAGCSIAGWIARPITSAS